MGFKVGRVFKLEFEGTDAAGAVVKVRSTSIGRLLDLGATTRREDAEFLGEHLVEWDLEYDDDKPVPLTVDGLLSLEEPFMYLIYTEWLRATRGMSVPFDRRSADGEPSPAADPTEPFIQMEPPSDSPPPP